MKPEEDKFSLKSFCTRDALAAWSMAGMAVVGVHFAEKGLQLAVQAAGITNKPPMVSGAPNQAAPLLCQRQVSRQPHALDAFNNQTMRYDRQANVCTAPEGGPASSALYAAQNLPDPSR
ncbi:MAG: hypothetical protein H6855_01405 [Rhodospirillales bacterium]|nr:hypothetical protein [Rhodospirillales bacterium]MCB9964727.1 hypothetical protein [Rhodospirillales bacterium]MCB9980625.1 hypothetical protein [Rhodospirillales bacterium]